jgi:hypothetical protein
MKREQNNTHIPYRQGGRELAFSSSAAADTAVGKVAKELWLSYFHSTCPFTHTVAEEKWC